MFVFVCKSFTYILLGNLQIGQMNSFVKKLFFKFQAVAQDNKTETAGRGE